LKRVKQPRAGLALLQASLFQAGQFDVAESLTPAVTASRRGAVPGKLALPLLRPGRTRRTSPRRTRANGHLGPDLAGRADALDAAAAPTSRTGPELEVADRTPRTAEKSTRPRSRARELTERPSAWKRASRHQRLERGVGGVTLRQHPRPRSPAGSPRRSHGRAGAERHGSPCASPASRSRGLLWQETGHPLRRDQKAVEVRIPLPRRARQGGVAPSNWRNSRRSTARAREAAGTVGDACRQRRGGVVPLAGRR